jgi:cell division protein FtsB
VSKRAYWLAGTCAAVGLGAAVHTVLSDSWTERRAVLSELDTLQRERAALMARVADLEVQVNALRHRSEAQARVIRQELGYVEPGEIVLEMQALPGEGR